MATSIETGEIAPDVTLQDGDGNDVRLADLRGKTVVLYFYPKDDTSGCTTQACDIRDNWSIFDRDDLVLYGVSPDGAKSHSKFATKYRLPFPLLVDEDHALADRFGIWGQKSLYGKKYFGIVRSTVIIDPDGSVRSILRNVKPAEHVALLREELGI
jgi:peroxiredoxin Q/BCP